MPIIKLARYRDAGLIVESEPVKGVRTYFSWRITGRRKEDVEREITKLTSSVNAQTGFAKFSHPYRIREKDHYKWYQSVGITCDDVTSE